MSPRRLRRKVAKARYALYAYARDAHKLDITVDHTFVHKVTCTALRLIDTPAYDRLFPTKHQDEEQNNDDMSTLDGLLLELLSLEGALFVCALAVVKRLSGNRLSEPEAWCLLTQALKSAVDNKKMPVSTDIRREAEREIVELVDLVAEFFSEKQPGPKFPIKITDIKPEKHHNGIRTDTDGENP